MTATPSTVEHLAQSLFGDDGRAKSVQAAGPGR